MSDYYIASCVFTSQFPELSVQIQNYVSKRFGLNIVRCCVPKYKISEFENRMPDGKYRDLWCSLPDSAPFSSEDEVYSLCHNCNNIIEEMHPGIHVRSLWELVVEDDSFPFPDYKGMNVTVQDCWRSRERRDEQDAVRRLLDKMNISWIEAPRNHEKTDFCGNSLYRPQPPRNPKLAPKHYVEGVEGLFIPHTEEEQKQIMHAYCSQYQTETVICYCHYCLEGLKTGRKDGKHMAEMLFGQIKNGRNSKDEV